MASYPNALKAPMNISLMIKKVPMEALNVQNSQKLKRLGEVEGSLWHAWAKITGLRNKLYLILKSIDEELGLLMGLKIDVEKDNKKARVMLGGPGCSLNACHITKKSAVGGPIPRGPQGS